MGCCDGIIKYLLFFFNLIFSLSGLALIIAGSVILYQSSGYKDILSDIKSGMQITPIILIVLGVIVFITATLGCCGAINGNRCKLITFAIFLLTILIIELAVGIYAALNISDVKDVVTKGMRNYFDTMFSNPKHEAMYHDMEKVLQCCGVIGPQDYVAKGRPIPESCFSDTRNLNFNNSFNTGCAVAVTDLTTTAGKVIAALGIVLAIIEIMGAAFALRLASLVHKVY